jgi:hypothetical protein
MVTSTNKEMTSNKVQTTEVHCCGGQPRTTYYSYSMNIVMIRLPLSEFITICYFTELSNIFGRIISDKYIINRQPLIKREKVKVFNE